MKTPLKITVLVLSSLLLVSLLFGQQALVQTWPYVAPVIPVFNPYAAAPAYICYHCLTAGRYAAPAATAPILPYYGQIRSYDLLITKPLPRSGAPATPVTMTALVNGFCTALDAAQYAERMYPQQNYTINPSAMPCWRPVGAWGVR